MEAKGGALVVLAELLTRPSLLPANTLYANARVLLKYRVKQVVSGKFDGPEVLIQVPVLQDRKPLHLREETPEMPEASDLERMPAGAPA